MNHYIQLHNIFYITKGVRERGCPHPQREYMPNRKNKSQQCASVWGYRKEIPF